MLSKMNFKQKLLTGFLAAALMTILAGSGGVLAIGLIRNNMSETANEVNSSVAREISLSQNIRSLKDVIDKTINATEQSEIDSIKTNLEELEISGQLLTGIRTDFKKDIYTMISAKESELEAEEKLMKLNQEMSERFEHTHKEIAKIVDDVVFDSIIAIEKNTEIENDDGVVSSEIKGKLKSIADDTTVAISDITAGLSVRAYTYQMHASLAEILLSQDIAFVDYSLSAINVIFDNIKSELENLKSINTKENMEKIIGEIRLLVPNLLKAKRNVLTAKTELESFSNHIANDMERVNKSMIVDTDNLKKAVDDRLANSSIHAKRWSVYLLVICLVSFIISTLVGVSLSRTLSTSIDSVVRRVRDIAEGDLSKNIAIDRYDEIGILATHFNTMVETLRDLLAKSKMAANKMTTTSMEILETSRQQAEGAKEQSSAVSQTTSASVELSKTSEQIGESIKAVSQMANHVLEGMEKIKKTTDQTSQILESLNEKSKQIGRITELIDDVADQTNLLAINASIEAARAGEQGRGFTVVADQISKLADSTAKSTKDINSLIELIQHEMSNAIISMEQSNSSVGEEIRLAEDSAEKSNEIAMNANQQLSGSKQIAEAMGTIDETMRQIASGAEQSATVVQQLIDLADELNESIEKFRVKEDENAITNA